MLLYVCVSSLFIYTIVYCFFSLRVILAVEYLHEIEEIKRYQVLTGFMELIKQFAVCRNKQIFLFVCFCFVFSDKWQNAKYGCLTLSSVRLTKKQTKTKSLKGHQSHD